MDRQETSAIGPTADQSRPRRTGPAKEKPTWGYGKFEGELGKRGHEIGGAAIRDVLKRNRVLPAPERGRHGSTWRTFLTRWGTRSEPAISSRSNRMVEDAVCPVFSSRSAAVLACRSVHLKPDECVGYIAGASLQLDHSGQNSAHPLPDPRPRHDVRGCVRLRVYIRGCEDHPDLQCFVCRCEGCLHNSFSSNAVMSI